MATILLFTLTNLPIGAWKQLVAPTVDEKYPFGHMLTDVAALSATYSPRPAILQLLLSVEDWYCPELQSVHRLWLLILLYVPASHGRQFSG